MSRRGPVAALLLVAPVAAAAPPPPIIDMHKHAAAADSQGPPPLGMCTPIDPFSAWDSRTPYGATFHAFFKKPPCPDPVWSTEVPRRSPPRGPPFWKSRVLRRQALGDEDDAQGCSVPHTA
jgi:hypothetical protein